MYSPEQVVEMLQQKIEEECDGNMTAFARKHNIAPSYMHDSLNLRRGLGEKTLKILGLKKCVVYVPEDS